MSVFAYWAALGEHFEDLARRPVTRPYTLPAPNKWRAGVWLSPSGAQRQPRHYDLPFTQPSFRQLAHAGRALTAWERSPLVIAAAARASIKAQDRVWRRLPSLVFYWRHGTGMGLVLHPDDPRRWPRLVPQRTCVAC